MQVLEQLRQGKGAEYSRALAGALAQLQGERQRQARDALASRFASMKAEPLGGYFKAADAELRRAAARAVAMRDDIGQITNLSRLLNVRNEPSCGRTTWL
jgi:hypothetical protein